MSDEIWRKGGESGSVFIDKTNLRRYAIEVARWCSASVCWIAQTTTTAHAVSKLAACLKTVNRLRGLSYNLVGYENETLHV